MDNLSSDFQHDLSVFLEQLERHGIIPESLDRSKRLTIVELKEETVESLINSVNSYDMGNL